MIAQVMQQLIGPVFQRASGDSVSPQGGDQGAEFAGIVAEGDDSLRAAEGVTKGVTDIPPPPTAMPELMSQTPAVTAVQFGFAGAVETPTSLQNQQMLSAIAVQDRAGASATAGSPNAAPHVPNALTVLAAEPQPDMVASVAFAKVDGGEARAALGQGGVVIDPSLVGTSSAEGLPDLAQMVRQVTTSDAPDFPRTTAKVLDAAQKPAFGAVKDAPDNPASISAHSGTALDGTSGSTSQPRTSLAPSAPPNIVLQSLRPLLAQSLAAGQGAKAGASDPPLAQQPVDRTGDGPAPRVTLRPVSPAANVALAALQGIVQNADIQTQVEGTSAAGSARGGEAVVLQAATAQQAAPSGQGAVAAAAQSAAQMSAALFASGASDTSDLLGIVPDEDAHFSLFEIDARHGFAPSLGVGVGAGVAGTASPVFMGAPPTAAQLSAQLLPLAQSAQSGPVELVLSPAELGQLRFEIHHRGEQVQIVLSAERPETLDLLRRNSEQLLTDFRNAGFAGASLAFGGWGAGQNAGGNPQEFGSDGQGDGGRTVVQSPSSPPSQNAGFARAQSYLDPSRSLNLRL